MPDSIKRLWYRLVPPEIPFPVRLIARITFIFFTVIGLLMMLKVTTTAQTITTLLYFVLLGVLSSAAVIGIYRLLMHYGLRMTFSITDTEYRAKGYTKELAAVATAGTPFTAPREKLIEAYLNLMAENYSGAYQILQPMMNKPLAPRLQALRNTCLIRYHLLTGRVERAQTIFETYAVSQDEAYEMEPELLPEVHEWIDDALLYYMSAAMFSAMRGRGEEAERYVVEAERQAEKHENRVNAELLLEIMQLDMLYAAGRFAEADARAVTLRDEIGSAVVLSMPHRDHLYRRVDQAAICANVRQETALDITKDRKIPCASEQVPAAAVRQNVPDEMPLL